MGKLHPLEKHFSINHDQPQAICLFTVGNNCVVRINFAVSIIDVTYFAVLVGLYEEPEKPNSALEYPYKNSC